MKYPIIKVTTNDNITLFGFLSESTKRETIVINIHGTASGFYVEEFEKYYVETLPEKGISILFTNNRGNYVMESWQNTGAAMEIFEDCITDIDAWIKYCLDLGYKNIILQGHSLGTEKVVYYMNKGSFRETVKAVILLGFADSYGCQEKILKTIRLDLMKEAKQLVEDGKGHQFLTSYWLSHAGVLPMSANSYLNFFSEGSELSKALPLRNGKELLMLRQIKVPILGIIGDKDQWLVLPLEEEVDLIKKENPNAHVIVITDCTHSFEGKQQEVIIAVNTFFKDNSLI